MKIHGNRFLAGLFVMGGALFLTLACSALTGCEDDSYDHDPPEGQGTLYIDNRSANDLDVYIDGTKMKDVDSSDTEHYDMDPGTYRVSLSGDDTPRSFSDFVDVLEGRRTIMEVWTDNANYRRFDVRIYFDD